MIIVHHKWTKAISDSFHKTFALEQMRKNFVENPDFTF